MKYSVGIDLGTTHTALSLIERDADVARGEVLAIPQLVARASIEAQPLLPSFAYFAHESERAYSPTAKVRPGSQGRASAPSLSWAK